MEKYPNKIRVAEENSMVTEKRVDNPSAIDGLKGGIPKKTHTQWKRLSNITSLRSQAFKGVATCKTPAPSRNKFTEKIARHGENLTVTFFFTDTMVSFFFRTRWCHSSFENCKVVENEPFRIETKRYTCGPHSASSCRIYRS